MSRRLIDLNEPLRRLLADGYNIDVDSAYLIVRDIPYVDARAKVRYDGILATSLNLNGETLNAPDDHTIKFAGEYPCGYDGQPLEAIRHSDEVVRISERVTTNRSFSAKPTAGAYADYYDKIRTYAALLSGPAAVLDAEATAQTRRVVATQNDDSPFVYLDTASARADINMATRKLAVQNVAIVGLGGTGSYVLDLVAKTPVAHIHLYDGDTLSSHNAFRSPGAAALPVLETHPLKVEYFSRIYAEMHRGIVPHAEYVGAGNVEQLRGMDFVFLCLDASKEKDDLVRKLEEFQISFIDVGMGLYLKDDTLGGIVRVTTSLPDDREPARARIPSGGGAGLREYDKNIQIADLNALNATLAVVRWKKLCGFYFDRTQERHTTFTVASGMLLNEDGPLVEADG